MRTRLKVSLTMLLFVVSACSPPSSTKSQAMMAGSGEKTFGEAYAPDLQLPMQEEIFEKLLTQKRLKFRVLVGPDPVRAFPLPSKESGVNRSDLAKCIEIYGKYDPKDRSMEKFNAYVDKSGNVIFIENAFVYTGP